MTSLASPPFQVLTSIAERLTVTGVYQSPEKAVAGMALAQVDQEIVQLQAQIAALWRKHQVTVQGVISQSISNENLMLL